jgi:diguanylate cyclase (GGDEF)-like protein
VILGVFESMLLAVAGAYLFGSLVRERIAALYEHAASTDPLTGIANRRAFLHQGARLVQRAAAEGRQVSLLLFDLDRFKSINDEHGHAAGDSVLRSFCTVATAQLRPGDLFARIGGEEFACVLVGVSAKVATIVAERVRFAFEGTTHRSGEHSFSATVSAGLAVSAAEYSDLPSLMISADRALYRAKKNGRNLVVEEQPADRSPTVLGSRSA